MPARRSVLASIGLGLAGAFGGCSTLSGAVNESTSSATDRGSASPRSSAKPASTATGEAASTTEGEFEYALAYERYYLAYRAIYALGPQTPDSQTDGPTHDFPDVRLGEVDAEATQRSGDRVVVRLTYDRLFEGESQGEFTVKYSVSADRTVRAATDGRVSQGPDLAENGRIQHCGA